MFYEISFRIPIFTSLTFPYLQLSYLVSLLFREHMNPGYFINLPKLSLYRRLAT